MYQQHWLLYDGRWDQKDIPLDAIQVAVKIDGIIDWKETEQFSTEKLVELHLLEGV